MDDLVDRLKAPSNWLAQGRGLGWKDAINTYDRAPFEAASEISRLRGEVERLEIARKFWNGAHDRRQEELATLARRSAAAGELLEALKGIEEYAHEKITDAAAEEQEGGKWNSDDMSKWGAVLAAIAQFEGQTAATQETRNGP